MNGTAITKRSVISIDEVQRLVKELSPEEKEDLAKLMFAELPADAKMRTMASEFGSSGLVIVMGGSNCSVNSEIVVQIQNAPNLDFAQVMEALVNRHKSNKSRIG